MAIAKLKAKLDTIFSQYIRLRDSNDEGLGQCITCGIWVPYKQADAGHFMTRNHLATRFHERNVHLQCKGCNGPRGGMQYEHGKQIDAKYGAGTAEKLAWTSKQNTRIDRGTYMILIDLYTKQVAKLKAQKRVG